MLLTTIAVRTCAETLLMIVAVCRSMIVGSLPSVLDSVELLFLLAWVYERQASALLAAGDAESAAAVSALADAGYGQVFTESTGTQLKSPLDKRWAPWHKDANLWIDRAYVYASVGIDLLACDALGVVLAMRSAASIEIWRADRPLWFFACRCAVRTGGWRV